MGFVAITGTVKDPIGQPYALGRITADFLPATGVIHNYGGNPIPEISLAAGLDSTGAFVLSLLRNPTDIAPTGSKWRITVTSADGSKNFSIDYSVTAAADISATLNAAAVSLGAAVNSGVLPNNFRIFTGTQTSRATVRAEVDAIVAHANVAIGSLYLSSAGKQYVKVADAAADTDWQRTTTTAAD